MSVMCPNCRVRKMHVQNHMRSVPVYACESYGYPDKNCGYVISVVEYEIEHGLSTRKERINQRLRNRIYNGNVAYAEADIEYLLSKLGEAEKALEVAQKHIDGTAEKFSEREKTPVLYQINQALQQLRS